MVSYRLYIIRAEGGYSPPRHGDYPGDAVALNIATDMAHAGERIEVWSGNRFVGEVGSARNAGSR